jgi:thiosulfate/3-mercaptopyruvate sulfurtransferase
MTGVPRRPLLALPVALLGAGWALRGAARAALAGPQPPAARWVVSAEEAGRLIAAGALVLDARGERLKRADPVSGAVPVLWQQFVAAEPPASGQLLADEAELTARLRAVGVRAGTPVVVLGDPLRGWGEDGRIVWMLRSLGHDRAVAVDGGLPALRAVGLPPPATPHLPGDFVIARRPELAIGRDELKGLLGRADVVILDARSPAEYAGAVRHGEPRGGHLPGAVSLHFRELIGEDGRILPPERLAARLAALGVGPETEVATYCTGGVRSAWLAMVLNDLGIGARNYPGSIWEWAASDPREFPLVTD